MMHDFLWLGFNADESGGKAVDGVINWIGGATGIYMNYRFAQPFRTHRQHIGRWFPEFQQPFTNRLLRDPVTGKTDGRLARCSTGNTCRKRFEVNSANDYWAKNMAVSLVDAQGKALPDEPANVRWRPIRLWPKIRQGPAHHPAAAGCRHALFSARSKDRL